MTLAQQIRRPARRIAVTAVLALAVSPLAACGSSDSSAADPATSTSASETPTSETPTSGTPSSAAPTSDAPPSTSSSTAPPATSEPGSLTPADFIAVYQRALDQATTAKVKLTVDGPSGALSGDGAEDFGTKPPSGEFTLTMGNGQEQISVILADGVAYVKAPQLGGKYFKVDIGQAFGGSSDLFDPTTTLPLLQKYIRTVKDVGSETVNGQSVEHYALTLDAKGAVAALAGGTKIPTSSLPDTLKTDMYFDQDGYIAQMTVDEGSTLGKTTIAYSDWGSPVTIKAPDPSQVTTLPGGAPTS